MKKLESPSLNSIRTLTQSGAGLPLSRKYSHHSLATSAKNSSIRQTPTALQQYNTQTKIAHSKRSISS